MKYRYTKYTGNLLDEIDLDDLVSKLSDLLLSSGFNNPWGGPQDEEDRSMQALHDAILEALFNGGVLSEEAIQQLLGDPADRVPGNADEADRARFAKLRDHLLRLDDEVVCKTCGKKFEIPSHHSLLFVDQLEGLPKDDELEAEIAAAAGESPAAPAAKGPLPARFTRPSRGWK